MTLMIENDHRTFPPECPFLLGSPPIRGHGKKDKDDSREIAVPFCAPLIELSDREIEFFPEVFLLSTRRNNSVAIERPKPRCVDAGEKLALASPLALIRCVRGDILSLYQDFLRNLMINKIILKEMEQSSGFPYVYHVVFRRLQSVLACVREKQSRYGSRAEKSPRHDRHYTK